MIRRTIIEACKVHTASAAGCFLPWSTYTLTCVAPQGESMSRHPKGAGVEVDGEQERRCHCARCQRQQQLKQRPQRGPEHQQQQQQHTADAQAKETWGRDTNKAQCSSRGGNRRYTLEEMEHKSILAQGHSSRKVLQGHTERYMKKRYFQIPPWKETCVQQQTFKY